MPVATPRVGARMEEVAPRKVGDVSDWVRIVALAGVSVALHGWLLAHTYVTARDSIGFARYALQLENPAAVTHPNGVPFTMTDVLKHGQHPPGYPMAVLAVSKVVREVYHPGGPAGYELACQMLLSAQIASSLAAVFLVAPSYWLGRMLFGKFAGFAAALLFQVLPVAAHVTADGLTEGLFLLTLGTALLLGTRAIKNPGIGGSLLCGLAGGLTYLVRPEGLAVVGAVGAVMVGMAAVRRWPRRATAARITALGVGVMIPAAPYMALIGGISNKNSPNAIFDKLIKGHPRERVAENRVDGPQPALFAAWYDKEKDGSLPVWVVKAIAKETFKTFHYVPAVLAVFGLAVAVRRLRAEPWVWVPILFGGMMLAMLAALAYIGQTVASGDRQHYVSERHTLSIVYVGCFFAAGGLVELTRRIKHPAAPAVVLAALVASCLPSAVRPLHENRAGHKYIGEVLRDQAGPDDTIIDPWDWAQWYAGRTLVWIHPDPEPLAGRYRWAILEPGDDPNSESPRYPLARAVAADQENKAEVIARWPEDTPLEKAKVVLYRQRITPVDEARWRAAQGKAQAEAEAAAKGRTP